MRTTLFAYTIECSNKEPRTVRGYYDPAYGYTCSEGTTNGSWGGLYNALYELDPAYAKSPDHAALGMTVTPLDVPQGMLDAAVGFIALGNKGSPFKTPAQAGRIAIAKAALERRLAPAPAPQEPVHTPCSRCGAPATDPITVVDDADGTQFILCGGCKQGFYKFIHNRATNL